MRLNCFHCGKRLQVVPEQLGMEVQCPHCQGIVSLPSADQLEEEAPFSLLQFKDGVSGLVSMLIHMTLMLVLALISCERGGHGIGDEILIGEIAAPNLSENQEDELNANDANDMKGEADETMDEIAPPTDVSESADTLSVNIASLSAGGMSGGGGDIGKIAGSSGTLGEGASFMGLHAKGSRFCIIADRSGSMDGPKLNFVKQEILETLTSMKNKSRFQLFFFNFRHKKLPGKDWRHPRKARPEVERWMQTILAGGGTDPLSSFQQAFKLKPRPDAIFFMTDGLFPAGVVDEIARMNKSGEKRVRIHTISFMNRESEALLKKIAQDSGGKYRHVSGF